jgi:hypothetical protein
VNYWLIMPGSFYAPDMIFVAFWTEKGCFWPGSDFRVQGSEFREP